MVKQSIHEHVSFIKLQEGYPLFFAETNQDKHNFVQTVPNGTKINILDIYESLSAVTKVAGICHQSCKEMFELHRPENGFLSSTLELEMMFFTKELIASAEDPSLI